MLALALAGCETATSRTSAGFSDAAMSPLNDLNMRRDEVPPLLAAIRSAYEPIPDVSCTSIAKMVADLTAILGRDTDAPPLPERSLGEVAGEGAADMTLGAVSSTMSDFIPFRSLVREATGASAHERRPRAGPARTQITESCTGTLCAGAVLSCTSRSPCTLLAASGST